MGLASLAALLAGIGSAIVGVPGGKGLFLSHHMTTSLPEEPFRPGTRKTGRVPGLIVRAMALESWAGMGSCAADHL